MKIIEKDYNVITGEETITERDATAEEIAAAKAAETAAKAAAAETAAKAAARQAVLDKLGLTAEDIAALGL
jgi:hypothetical protein